MHQCTCAGEPQDNGMSLNIQFLFWLHKEVAHSHPKQPCLAFLGGVPGHFQSLWVGSNNKEGSGLSQSGFVVVPD